MTMLDAAQKIPKGVNIIIFIWALIGLYILIRDPKFKKDFYFWLYTLVIAFMVAWRVAIRILTSRYASGLIIPFVVLASVFLVNSVKRRHLIVRLGLYVLIAVTGVIVLKMNLDSTTRNYYSDTIAEIYEDLGQSREKDYTFLVEHDDYSRIYFLTHLGKKVGRIKDDEVHDFVSGYRRIYPDTILNTPSKNITDEISRLDNMRLLASLIEKKTSKRIKKQFIYAVSGHDECVPISKSQIVPRAENDLLENGDMEELDSPEESYGKLETYLGSDALIRAVDPALRTPQAAYFTFVLPDEPPAPSAEGAPGAKDHDPFTNGTASLPGFSMQSDFSIDGDRSARICAADGTASLMFEKRFHSGRYEYSMLVQGETGTEISVFYEVCRPDGGCELRTVALLTLPDKRLFQVRTRFSADDLADADFFRVGVSVRNGAAFFDDFSLRPGSAEVLTARDAD